MGGSVGFAGEFLVVHIRLHKFHRFHVDLQESIRLGVFRACDSIGDDDIGQGHKPTIRIQEVGQAASFFSQPGKVQKAFQTK